MNEQFGQAVQCVADVNAIARGLAMSLDSMEDELAVDARYYALKACVDTIVEKSTEAAVALDMFDMEVSGEQGA